MNQKIDYTEVDGDLIKLAINGKFDVIAHGCNCLSTMGAGIAVPMKQQFGCDKFKMELMGPNILKLGNIDYETQVINNHKITIVNAYTQYKYGRNHKDGVKKPFDYQAFTLCMRKMNIVFKGKHIGLPKIGSDLAGGNWEEIKTIIQQELTDCKVTVVRYKK